MVACAEAPDGVGEVEVDAQRARADPAAFVADRLGRARGDVAGREVPEARIPALEVVVALGLGDLVGAAAVAPLLGHPDAPIVPERLAHQRELGLVVPADRDAGRMDLGVAGVGEGRAPLVRPPDGRDVRPLGVGREVEHVAVAAGPQDHGVGRVALDLAGDHVAHDDAAGAAVDHDEIQHLGARVHRDPAPGDLLLQRLIGAEQELLPRLAAGVEGPRDLGPAEGAVRQQAAVLPGERHPLGHALIDDLDADLRQPVDVGLARAEVAALDRVVEQPVDAVAVVPVVLGRVDAALRRDRVRPPGRVLEAETLHLVAQLAQRGRRGAPGQPAAHHDHGELPLVRRVHQLHLEPVLVPFLLDGTARDPRSQLHVSLWLTAGSLPRTRRSESP